MFHPRITLAAHGLRLLGHPHRLVLVRLGSQGANALDRAHPRHWCLCHWPDDRLHVGQYLFGRLLPPLRRLGDGRQHGSTIAGWGPVALGWTFHVRCPGLGMGQFSSRLHCARDVCVSAVLLAVRGTHPDAPSISGQVVKDTLDVYRQKHS